MAQSFPTTERLMIGSLLAASAGGFDAFTYLQHGEVFAGLQTGNLILLGVHLGQGQFGVTIHYLIPILAFIFGTMVARFFQHTIKKSKQPLAAPQLIITWEILLTAIVALADPILPDLLASALISMTAAAQLQEFRKLKGGPFTSLMMTGNLRTVAEGIYDGLIHHNTDASRKALDILTIIISFSFGAGLVGGFSQMFSHYVILISTLFLSIIWLVFWRSRLILSKEQGK